MKGEPRLSHAGAGRKKRPVSSVRSSTTLTGRTRPGRLSLHARAEGFVIVSQGGRYDKKNPRANNVLQKQRNRKCY